MFTESEQTRRAKLCARIPSRPGKREREAPDAHAQGHLAPLHLPRVERPTPGRSWSYFIIAESAKPFIDVSNINGRDYPREVGAFTQEF